MISSLTRCSPNVPDGTLDCLPCGAASGTAAAQESLVPDQLIRMMQFHVSNSGEYEGSTSAAGDIVDSIRAGDPHVVTLNEICRSTYNELYS